MTGLEWLLKAPVAAYSAGSKQVELGHLGYQQMFGPLTPQQTAHATAIEKQTTNNFGADGWFQSGVVEFSRMAPMIVDSLAKGAERGIQTGVALGTGAALLGQAGPQAALPEELVTVPAATAAGFGIGMTAGAIEESFKLESGLAYREFIGIKDANGKPLDPGVARVAAMAAGSVNAALETFGLRTLVKSFPGGEKVVGAMSRQGIRKALQVPTIRAALTNFVKGYGKVITAETATEVAQEASTMLAGEIAKATAAGDFKHMTGEDVANRLAEVAKKTAQAMSVGGLPGPGARFVVDVRKARAAKHNQRTIEALGKNAEASKLRKRLPDRYRAFVDAATKDGPIQNINIPEAQFREYFQSKNLNPDEIAKDLGVLNQMAEARATGGDLVVPLADYQTKIAGTEHHAGLAPDLRFHPGEMTMREADAFNAEVSDALQATYDITRELADMEQTRGTPSDRVFEDVRTQLLNAGRPLDVATREAAVHRAFFKAMGERTGTDAFDLYAATGLQIRGALPESLKPKDVNGIDILIERLRSGDVPSTNQVSGDSLLEFLAKNGGLKDHGGELKSRSLDIWHKDKAFRRKLVRNDGMNLDDAALKAWEAGYFPKSKDRPDINALLAAIDAEARGDKQFADGEVNTQAADMAGAVADLDQFLIERGIDVNTATNTEIKAALKDAAATSSTDAQVSYSQPLNPGVVLNQPVNFIPVDPIKGEGRAGELAKNAASKADVSPITNADTGWVIGLSSGKLRDIARKWEKSTDHRDHVAAFHAVRKITEQAVLVESHADKKGRRQVKQVHRLFSAIDIAGRRYAVKTTVLEYTDGRKEVSGGVIRRLHEQRLEKKLPAAPGVDGVGAGTSSARSSLAPQGEPSNTSAPANTNTTTIRDLLAGLKDQAGKPFFKIDDGTKRGSIRFADGAAIVDLFEGADLSTFLHETGHFFLESFGNIAKDSGATDQIAADWQTVLDFLDVKDGAAIKTDQHEKFARAFEAYLFEGKAPSVELQSVFQRFRAWLVNIYRDIAKLNVKVNDQMKAVFDRMLATDDEIRAAEDHARYDRMFRSAAEAGMTKAEYAAYVQSDEQATEKAKEELLRRSLKEITRERKQWWKDESAKVRTEVEASVNSRPIYRALHFLQTGELPGGEGLPKGMVPLKISRAALVEQYGEGVLKLLPRGLGRVYAKAGGVHPDVIADLFGFSSGDELVQTLMNVHPRNKVIEAETAAIMRERHGDMLHDGSIESEAASVIHGDQRAGVLATELRTLTKRAGYGDTMPREVPRAAAERIIAAKKVADAVLIGRYAAAEVKAARAAQKAMDKGDWAKAAEEKRRQVLSHALFMESRKAADEVDKAVRFFGKFGKQGTRKNLTPDYLEQIDALLERFDFRRGVSLKAIEKRKALASWVADKEADGNQVAISDKLLNEAYRRHYKDMTLEELRGLKDAVKSIEHLGRLKNRLLRDKERRDFNEVVGGLVGSIFDNNKTLTEGTAYSPTFRDKLKRGLSRVHAEHTKMEFLFRTLDGRKDLGPVWSALFQPMAEAETAEQSLMADVVKGLNKAFGRYSRFERARWNLTRTFVPEVGKSFTKAEILSIALNQGNESSRAALMEGMDWQEGHVNAVLQHLDQRDWDTVQEIWDLINTLWPKIETLQKDLTGVAPTKVEAVEVVTPHGTYKGGYYPLKYDPEHSYRAFQRDEKQATSDLFESNWLRPSTRQGHTKERVGSAGQRVKLDLSVLTEHLSNVIHDVTHRKAILDVDKLIQDRRVREAIERTAGKDMYRQMRPWLQAIANDQKDPSSTLERFVGRARAGASVVAMGWKVTTAIVQPLGYLQTIERLGPKYSWIGLQKFFGKPHRMKDKIEFVMERSVMMQNRQKTFDRDVKDTIKKMTVDGPLTELQGSFFWMTGLMDMAVSVPTWLGAFEKGMGDFNGDEGKAIAYADSVVRMTQAAGGVKDLADIQRGSEFKRAFTMFYSYFSAFYNMMADRIGETNRIKDIPRFVAGMFFLWFAPAVMAEIIAGRGPGDDEDKAKWAAKNLIGYPFQAVIGLRDVVSAWTSDYGYGMTPVKEAFGSIVNTGNRLADGEPNKQLAKDALLAAGYWGKLPSRQMWITGSYLSDLMTGKEADFSLHKMFFARPRK